MIVNDFDLVRVAIAPGEAYTPPVVDPYAVLTRSIAGQFLETVPGREPQVLDNLRGVKEDQFLVGCPVQIGRQPPGALSGEDTFGLGVGEGAYHYEQ